MVNKTIFVSNYIDSSSKLKDVINKINGFETVEDFISSDFIISPLGYMASVVGKELKNNSVVQEGMNFDFICKEGFSKALIESGVKDLDVCYDASLENIIRFKDTKFIIKPKLSHSAFDIFDFTYKTFNGFGDFTSKLNMEEFKSTFLDSDKYLDYVVQRSLEDENGNVTQLFISGFVNPLGEIFNEGISTIIMKFDPRQEQSRRESNYTLDTTHVNAKYVSNFIRVSSGNFGDGFEDKCNFISQLTKLFNFHGIKSVPFICQALVDPLNPDICFLTDFSYKIRPFNYKFKSRHPYLEDKIKFMYNGTKIKDDSKFLSTYPNIDIPNGLTDSILQYLEENEISCDTYGLKLSRRNLPFQILGNSIVELQEKERNLRNFILNGL